MVRSSEHILPNMEILKTLICNLFFYIFTDKFVKEMKALRPMFVEEEQLMFTKEVKNKKKDLEDINLAKLEID